MLSSETSFDEASLSTWCEAQGLAHSRCAPHPPVAAFIVNMFAKARAAGVHYVGFLQMSAWMGCLPDAGSGWCPDVRSYSHSEWLW